MSDDVVIALEGVGKCFQLFDRPEDRLKQALLGRKRSRDFWALRDVSMTVRKGETVAIVGRNGSGKSTLLEIAAGILTPTTGNVRCAGRVAAMLELGSGFSPEFTGRENVFVSAAIQGFPQSLVEEKFDEIAAFSGIGAFLDQPLRTYSTGMVVRLAFATQACLPKEVLIVDEVLAVGDEAFQHQCFAKLEDFREQGGTTLFVSHSATLVVQLCERALFLDGGELLLEGQCKPVVVMYQRFLHAPAATREQQREELRHLGQKEDWDVSFETQSGGGARVRRAWEGREDTGRPDFDPELAGTQGVRYEGQGAAIENPFLATLEGERVNLLRRGETYVLRYSVVFEEARQGVRFAMLIRTVSGLDLGGGASAPRGKGVPGLAAGTRIEVSFSFVARLSPGTYFVNVGLLADLGESEGFADRWIDAVQFRVLPEEGVPGAGWVDFDVSCRFGEG